MGSVALATVVLGLAGFDPLGFFTFIAAGALGATRRNLLLMAGSTLVTTVLFGAAAVLGLGPLLHRWKDRLPHLTTGEVGWAAVVVGTGLAAWGIWRWLHRSTAAEQSNEHTRSPASTSAGGMLAAGGLVGASCLIDPAWYGMVAYAAGLGRPAVAVGVAAGWTVLSHILLVVLAVALAVGAYGPVERGLNTLRTRYRLQLWWSVTLALLAGGLGCVVYGVAHLLGA